MAEFPANFFEALGEDGGDAAMMLLRDAAFDSGLEREPSPRAQPFFNEGEWGLSRTLVTLTLVEADACFGLMPSLSSPRGTSYTRFCGKLQSQCEIRSHRTSKIREDMQIPGWYLAGGTGRQGSVWEVRFPLENDGGPISMAAALRILDPDRPFWMSFGQWLFVHSEWTSQRVVALSSEGSLELHIPLEVKTDLGADLGPPSVASEDADLVASGVHDLDAEPSPDLPARPMGGVESHELHRLATLEAQVETFALDIRALHDDTKHLLKSIRRQHSVSAGLSGRLDTAE
jgi:hypothetical protein